MILTNSDKKRIVVCLIIYVGAFISSILFRMLSHSLCVGILIFTGVIFVQAIVDALNPKLAPVFPVPLGIFCGSCIAVFIVIFAMLLK